MINTIQNFTHLAGNIGPKNIWRTVALLKKTDKGRFSNRTVELIFGS